MQQSTTHPWRVMNAGGPDHYAAGQAQHLQQAILRADWATVRTIAADPYTAGEDVDAAAGALAGANQPRTVPPAQMAPLEMLYAAARAARGEHQPWGGSWTRSVLNDALGDWLDQTARAYEVEREDGPECPGCEPFGGCGPHPPVDVHVVCQQVIGECACLAPALKVARALLRIQESV
ncbi:hypothetical protein [Micromonospora sp. NPDC005652]|uniref:hypothetical protein n=1 Tax=Micromonospora sp. NPDC005652 TaxID=3157046 RepID=UPI0033FFCA8C